MARTFEVISPYDGATLRLSEYDKDYFIAELIGANLQAKARVDTYMSVRSLATLFEEMAAGWRGWTGKKAWNSLE